MEMIYVHIYIRTTDIWLLQVRTSDQSRGSSDGNKLSLCCDYCLI